MFCSGRLFAARFVFAGKFESANVEQLTMTRSIRIFVLAGMKKVSDKHSSLFLSKVSDEENIFMRWHLVDALRKVAHDVLSVFRKFSDFFGRWPSKSGKRRHHCFRRNNGSVFDHAAVLQNAATTLNKKSLKNKDLKLGQRGGIMFSCIIFAGITNDATIRQISSC